MDESGIVAKLREHFGDSIVSTSSHRGQHAVTIRPASLVAVAELLRDDPELGFDMLMDIGGVDLLELPERRGHRFEVAYQFYSIDKNHRIRVKVACDEGDALPSLWEHWGVANWMEREVFDLFGLRFTGHPNLRRILCHEDFEGHALRKDYPINKRQQLSRPVENLLTDDPSWA